MMMWLIVGKVAALTRVVATHKGGDDIKARDGTSAIELVALEVLLGDQGDGGILHGLEVGPE